MHADDSTWTLTGVYGPQGDQEKILFLEELKNLKEHTLERWLLIGDFNLIYKAEDKSNDRLDRRMMNNFKQTLDDNQLMEIELRGRRFIWSNEQDNPTFHKD